MKKLLLSVSTEIFNRVEAGGKAIKLRKEMSKYWTSRLKDKKIDVIFLKCGKRAMTIPYRGYTVKNCPTPSFYDIVLQKADAKSAFSNPESAIKNLLESFLEHPAGTKQEQTEMIKVAVEEISALFNPHSAFRNPQSIVSVKSPCPVCETYTKALNQAIDKKKKAYAELAELKQQTESLVREQAKECGKYYNAGYKKGERDRDTVYSAAFGRAGLKQKVAGRIAGHVKKICLEVEQKGSFTQKQCDYRPTYERLIINSYPNS